MTGITGQFGSSINNTNELGIERLFRSGYEHEHYNKEITPNLFVLNLDETACIYQNQNIVVAIEGYLLNRPERGIHLCEWIINKFMEEGVEFIKNLRGSFQIVLWNKNSANEKAYLISDYIGSRPLFYTTKNKSIHFSPEINSLINEQQTSTLDKDSLVYFLISGCMPPGKTLINEVKLLKPGEYLEWSNGQIQLKNYYSYKIEDPTQATFDELIQQLNFLLQKSIIECWQHAKNPVVLLSGGNDSRYILYTIAEYVDDISKIKTVTWWGQNKNRPYSDMDIADKIAKYFGTKHIVCEKDINSFEEDFIKAFYAQSGMTSEAFIQANGITVSKKLRDEFSIHSVIRGDQCLGRKKVFSNQSALQAIGLSNLNYVKNKNWFPGNNEEFFKCYEKLLDSLIAPYKNMTPNDLRDTLTFNLKQPALQILNCYKYPYQQVYNPLLDLDVFELSKHFPGKYRDNKYLFREAFNIKFKKHRSFPNARYHNMLDWAENARQSIKAYNYFSNEIEDFPDIFDKSFFRSCLSSVKNKRNNGFKFQAISGLKKILDFIGLFNNLKNVKNYLEVKRDKEFVIPNIALIIRAIVVSRWIKLWL